MQVAAAYNLMNRDTGVMGDVLAAQAGHNITAYGNGQSPWVLCTSQSIKTLPNRGESESLKS